MPAGAPHQQAMEGAEGDLFKGAKNLFIKQEMAAVELCGIEAKQRYRISRPVDGREGDAFLYITEESACCERICCGPARSLTLRVHDGPSRDAPVVMEMVKPFDCGPCCCIMRPSFEVFEPARGGTLLGRVDDPCRCCVMDQQVVSAAKDLLFTTKGAICQLGIWCACCAGVNFDVAKDGESLAKITKLKMDCGELCLHTNRFTVNFDKIEDPSTKKMLLASAMLLDLQYFEQSK